MTRQKRLPHDVRARIHATHRAWQRFGLAVSLPDLLQAEGRIWSGKAQWLSDLRGMRQAYRVKLKDRSVVAVFDIHIEAIVTCLPDTPGIRLDGRRRVPA